MRPNTVYPTIATVNNAALPMFLHQCITCCVLTDGPFAGTYPTDSYGRRVLVDGDYIFATRCASCTEEHERIMRELLETDEVYETVE